ncbi:uncharacterized protein BX663DRAFT_225157 [Cokeromyces recurvatus]|uniref:uncharacterized protein n=1 Tax=Cokeromyces recurvatus TaxID=90255 RepID=UPI00221FEF6B|nr:uncharacterized protein BX663DRAFT_225157 [Cokeromyces recurvatus]KAI7899014.1 hypothetical protein BX663DRAFT_225157 [Cokeromyces recurvatus]
MIKITSFTYLFLLTIVLSTSFFTFGYALYTTFEVPKKVFSPEKQLGDFLFEVFFFPSLCLILFRFSSIFCTLLPHLFYFVYSICLSTCIFV